MQLCINFVNNITDNTAALPLHELNCGAIMIVQENSLQCMKLYWRCYQNEVLVRNWSQQYWEVQRPEINKTL
jgi:hypothetical protein